MPFNARTAAEFEKKGSLNGMNVLGKLQHSVEKVVAQSVEKVTALSVEIVTAQNVKKKM